MSGPARKLRKARLKAALLDAARAQGCVCRPDIVVPSPVPGRVRIAEIAHDPGCPLAERSTYTREFVARVNAGEMDP
jgi:hypothetical protein